MSCFPRFERINLYFDVQELARIMYRVKVSSKELRHRNLDSERIKSEDAILSEDQKIEASNFSGKVAKWNRSMKSIDLKSYWSFFTRQIVSLLPRCFSSFYFRLDRVVRIFSFTCHESSIQFLSSIWTWLWNPNKYVRERFFLSLSFLFLPGSLAGLCLIQLCHVFVSNTKRPTGDWTLSWTLQWNECVMLDSLIAITTRSFRLDNKKKKKF